MAWQIYVALAYGSRGVMYFFYANPAPPCNRPFLKIPGIVDAAGNPTHKYYQAKEINSKVVALGPTLMQLDSVDVVEVSWLQTDVQIEAQLRASAGCGLVSISHYYYTVGCFVASGDSGAKLTGPALAKGTRAVMIVNREHAHTALAKQGGYHVANGNNDDLVRQAKQQSEITKHTLVELALEYLGTDGLCHLDILQRL